MTRANSRELEEVASKRAEALIATASVAGWQGRVSWVFGGVSCLPNVRVLPGERRTLRAVCVHLRRGVWHASAYVFSDDTIARPELWNRDDPEAVTSIPHRKNERLGSILLHRLLAQAGHGKELGHAS